MNENLITGGVIPAGYLKSMPPKRDTPDMVSSFSVPSKSNTLGLDLARPPDSGTYVIELQSGVQVRTSWQYADRVRPLLR